MKGILLFCLSFLCGSIVYASSGTSSVSDLLAVMPNANFVALVDVQQIYSHRWFSTIINKDPKTSEEFKKVETLLASQGIDLRQVRYLAVGGTFVRGGSFGSMYFLVNGGFERERLMSSLAELKKVITTQTYEGSTIYLMEDSGVDLLGSVDQLKGMAKPQRIAFVFLSQDTVCLGDLDTVKNALDVRAGKQKSLMANTDMTSYIGRTSPAALMRFAIKIPPQEKQPAKARSKIGNDDLEDESGSSSVPAGMNDDPFGLSKVIDSVEATYGILDISSGITLDSNTVTKTEADAKQMSEALTGLLTLAKMMGTSEIKDKKQAKLLNDVLSAISISSAGREMRLTVSLSDALLDEIKAAIELEVQKSSAGAKSFPQE